ncbi:unnamed protein product, partial [Musa banksii]
PGKGRGKRDPVTALLLLSYQRKAFFSPPPSPEPNYLLLFSVYSKPERKEEI